MQELYIDIPSPKSTKRQQNSRLTAAAESSGIQPRNSAKLLAMLLVSSALAKEDVVNLGDSDFDSGLAKHKIALVMFYAPWCIHCQRLEPDYAKAAEDLVRNDPHIALVKVDCTEAQETCVKNLVNRLPTLKIFRNGEYSQDYNGTREANGIVQHMKAQVSPAPRELKSIVDFDKFLSSENESVVVGFFKNESDLKTTFLQLADQLRENVQFAQSTIQGVLFLANQGLLDDVVLFRPQQLRNHFEPNYVVYSGGAELSNLNDFVSNNLHGLAGVRKIKNQREFKSPLVVVYFSVDYVRKPNSTKYWRNEILKVAKEYKGRINFAISPSDEFTHELKEFGIEFNTAEKPRVAAMDAMDNKYAMKHKFSIKTLKSFVDYFLAKKLQAFTKSEPITDSQNVQLTLP